VRESEISFAVEIFSTKNDVVATVNAPVIR
jgi:hypothetical protein